MNITTFSPALVLLYVFVLLWILMGVDYKSFGKRKRCLFLFAGVFLGAGNHLLREISGPIIYGKLLLPCMHLPTFFLFLFAAKRGVIKTAFMILTALVFTMPAVLIGNLVCRPLFPGSSMALLLSNLISYALMLLLAQFVFRKGFNYLMVYADNRLFLLFSLVPLMYYVYALAAVNFNFSSFSSVASFFVRLMPHIQILLFYFLVPYIYKSLSEKQAVESTQYALQQKLISANDRITLLNETNTQMAVYRHDMRHQLIVLGGLLSGNKIEQAQEFVKAAMADLDAVTPKQFCENETVNLLCSSYYSKAQGLGVSLTIKTLLPKVLPLSDTELCSVVANGLENALLAASQPEVADKWVDFSCEIKQNIFRLQIQNTYTGQVVIRNGLPVSERYGHGYGCRSIENIVQSNGGLCSFEADNGLFTLCIVIPMKID